MFNVGEYAVYKRDVCKIKDIKKNHILDKDYYILAPIDDESLVIEIPADNKNGFLKKVITKEEVMELIKLIPSIELIVPFNERMIENEYKQMINSGDHKDLIRIIKTAYLRNNNRINNGKKIGEKDNNYFKLAEKILYNEISVALQMTYDEAKQFVVDKVAELEN